MVKGSRPIIFQKTLNSKEIGFISSIVNIDSQQKSVLSYRKYMQL